MRLAETIRQSDIILTRITNGFQFIAMKKKVKQPWFKNLCLLSHI